MSQPPAVPADTACLSTCLPVPELGRPAAEEYLRRFFEGLHGNPARARTGAALGSERFVGGQSQADRALAGLDIDGYAAKRNEVFPQPGRGATGLSPYLRHGLLGLAQVWNQVDGGPEADVAKFRHELLWQEYSRHWYARLGPRTRRSLRHEPVPVADWNAEWEPGMACLEMTLDELAEDGWLVNQSRLWLAGHWVNRHGGRWQEGEDFLYRNLLDGSRAANRLGWQWAAGSSSAKAYRFTRWQVEERAAGLCATCDLVHSCPIEEWPAERSLVPVEAPVELRTSTPVGAVAGPSRVERSASDAGAADVVWLTAESLGLADPALTANPDLPVVFVFERALLARLQLAPKRLIFLIETLAELAEHRRLEIHLGDPPAVLAARRVAVTYAPVPGFRRHLPSVTAVEVHPWPWLWRPNGGSVASFSAWLKAHRSGSGDQASA